MSSKASRFFLDVSWWRVGFFSESFVLVFTSALLWDKHLGCCYWLLRLVG